MIDRVNRSKGSKSSDREERSERSSSSKSAGKSGGYKGYKRPSAESVKERSNRRGGTFDSIWKNSVPRFMYEKGKNPLRICPPTFVPENDHHFMQVWVHTRQGSDFSDYLCLKKMLKKPCAFCDAQAIAIKDDDADEVKKFKPTEQWVGWVLARDAEDDPDVAKAFKTSFTQDRNLSALSQSSKGGVVYVADPDNGYDINIIRKGSGLNTEYLISIDRESTPLLDSPKAQKKLLDWLDAHPINEQLEYKTYDYQEQVIKGVVEEKDEDLDDDEDEDTDKKSKSTNRNKRDEDDNEEDEEVKSDRRSSRGKKDEDEDEEEETSDEEEETSDEEEDEEDEKPTRRSSSRREKDEDEDEDEEEETSEDEESDEEEEDDDDKGSRRPSSKGRRGKTDNDDEEEEKPRRRTGRR